MIPGDLEEFPLSFGELPSIDHPGNDSMLFIDSDHDQLVEVPIPSNGNHVISFERRDGFHFYEIITDPAVGPLGVDSMPLKTVPTLSEKLSYFTIDWKRSPGVGEIISGDLDQSLQKFHFLCLVEMMVDFIPTDPFAVCPDCVPRVKLF